MLNEKKRYRKWTILEEICVISMWKEYITELRKSKHNGHVYEYIVSRLAEKGIICNRIELITKIKNLQTKYRSEKKKVSTDGEASSWIHYNDVDAFMDGVLFNKDDMDRDEKSFEEIDIDSMQWDNSMHVSIKDCPSDNSVDEKLDNIPDIHLSAPSSCSSPTPGNTSTENYETNQKDSKNFHDDILDEIKNLNETKLETEVITLIKRTNYLIEESNRYAKQGIELSEKGMIISEKIAKILNGISDSFSKT